MIKHLVDRWLAEVDAEILRLRQYCYGGPFDGQMTDDDLAVGFAAAAEKMRCAHDLEAALDLESLRAHSLTPEARHSLYVAQMELGVQ